MTPLAISKGKYTARLSRQPADIRAAQALRHRAFFDAQNPGFDVDEYDAKCDHVLIEEHATDTLVGCFRVLGLPSGAAIGQSYSAQFYDLSRLETYPRKMIEMGRFCVANGQSNPEILRMAWAMMTRLVDGAGFEMMFGCSSFAGTDPAPYQQAFTMLNQQHTAPDRWQPMVKSAQTVRFDSLPPQSVDARTAIRALPSLLRTYLAMGGRVSDHAVIDPDLNTLHVFTGLEVRLVPPARARALRSFADERVLC